MPKERNQQKLAKEKEKKPTNEVMRSGSATAKKIIEETN
jgi:hypothetical protein